MARTREVRVRLYRIVVQSLDVSVQVPSAMSDDRLVGARLDEVACQLRDNPFWRTVHGAEAYERHHILPPGFSGPLVVVQQPVPPDLLCSGCGQVFAPKRWTDGCPLCPSREGKPME